jgi:hypothetical protein
MAMLRQIVGLCCVRAKWLHGAEAPLFRLGRAECHWSKLEEQRRSVNAQSRGREILVTKVN